MISNEGMRIHHTPTLTIIEIKFQFLKDCSNLMSAFQKIRRFPRSDETEKEFCSGFYLSLVTGTECCPEPLGLWVIRCRGAQLGRHHRLRYQVKPHQYWPSTNSASVEDAQICHQTFQNQSRGRILREILLDRLTREFLVLHGLWILLETAH